MVDHIYPKYVLITPARNEEAYIEKTIQSVIIQTVLPLRWVIVSDGSTDRTDEIVRRYSSKYDWIELIRRAVLEDRQFAAKVRSFNVGYLKVKDLSFDIIGNLDADLSFDQGYFEYLLIKFSQDPTLGVAGTPFVEAGTPRYDYRFTNIEHVSGACQLFRRACFESIDGYRPIEGGGIDWVAVIMARMKGWRTRTFTDKYLHHHRKMGTGNRGILNARYRQGQQDYCLGFHSLWEVLRTAYQFQHKPYLLGGLALLAGYVSFAVRRQKRPVPAELITYIHREQLERLKKILGLSKKRIH
jgi:biofilm PGA synthesis N-glycosyltransferase PgaC